MCGPSSSLWFALCPQLDGGDCWECRYATRYVTRLSSSLLQTILSPSMPEGRRRLLYGSSSSPLAALCSRLVGGDCWRCQPAAYCVLRPDSLVLQAVPLAVDSGWRLETLLAWLFVVAAVLLCALNSSAARWLAMPRGRLPKLLMWIFVVAFGSFMCRTRRQRWLALPACCSLRDGTRQLDAASHALTVDGGGV